MDGNAIAAKLKVLLSKNAITEEEFAHLSGNLSVGSKVARIGWVTIRLEELYVRLQEGLVTEKDYKLEKLKLI